jgi:hypothetical protein
MRYVCSLYVLDYVFKYLHALFSWDDSTLSGPCLGVGGTLASILHVFDFSKKGLVFQEERSSPNQIVPIEGTTVLKISLSAFQRCTSIVFNRAQQKWIVALPERDDPS